MNVSQTYDAGFSHQIVSVRQYLTRPEDIETYGAGRKEMIALVPAGEVAARGE